MEDWAEVRRLHRSELMPIKAIARRLGISKNTIKRALAAVEPPMGSVSELAFAVELARM